MIILLHSSKTMRQSTSPPDTLQEPIFLKQAQGLIDYIASLSTAQLMKSMHISEKVAVNTQRLFKEWDNDSQSTAMDSFIGDIYSGFRAHDLNRADREYANEHLRILSGLYGSLRPLDTISPYRLEMAYRFPRKDYASLYTFWGSGIADSLPKDGPIINTSSAEYMKAVLPYVDESRVVTPQFFTISSKTNEPTFVVVHAKIARGAFARWLILNRIEDISDLHRFDDLGYVYDEKLSAPNKPAFVCREFGGLGLSVRLRT